MTDGYRVSDAALLVSDTKRIVLLKPSELQPHVLRVCSAPVGEFDLSNAKAFVAFDDACDGWVLLPCDHGALDILKDLILPATFTICTKAPKNVQAVISAHLKLQGSVQEWCAATGVHVLPAHIQRIYDRLGPEGYLLVGAPMTFDKGRSAFRLAARSYAYHRDLEESGKLTDSLVAQMLAWNIISQSYVALEKFCAMLRALKASRSTPKDFGIEYLRFGRNEPDVQGASVTSMMDQILGKHGHNLISEALGIPIKTENIQALGLEDCGVDSQRLIEAGRYTRDIVVARFRELAQYVVQGRTPKGGAIKSVPAKAYGAFRHGFAAGFPVHLPNGTILHGSPDRFVDENDFLEHESEVNTKAEIMYLGERDSHGDRPIENVRPVIRSSELKPFVSITYRASFWTYELAKVARSYFGSVDLRFPYLVNASQILNPDEMALLQVRLDALEGM